jgi:ribonuclease HI
MSPSTPHYLLFSQSDSGQGGWRFVLRSTTGPDELEVAEQEPGIQGDRLELLSVVRGLEALDQPSVVTLMTPSKYVREGIRYGLDEWQSNGWRWEFYGEMVPVKNADLWQRVERAMRFHQVECRKWRVDSPHWGEFCLEGPHAPMEGGTVVDGDGGTTDQTSVAVERGSTTVERETFPRTRPPWRLVFLGWGHRAGRTMRRWSESLFRRWETLVSSLRFG